MAGLGVLGHPDSIDPPIPEGVQHRFVGLNSRTAKRALHGAHPVKGLYWWLQDSTPSTVFLAAHYNADFAEHYLAAPLAARGYGFLGISTRFVTAEDRFDLDQALDDLAAAVEWIRKEVDPKSVVFIGNSGGGSLMAALNAAATAEPHLAAAAGDGFIFLNSHIGRADAFTNCLDPSVADELDPVKTDSALDAFNPENGPPFSQEFIERYHQAQKDRNQRITDWSKAELKRLNELGIPDRLFLVFRSFADLRFLDHTIDPSTRKKGACIVGDPALANRSIPFFGRAMSLRGWLSMFSLEDSKARIEVSGPRFKTPTLILQGTDDVGVFPSDVRLIYDSIASEDKEIVEVPGQHFFEDSQEDVDRAADVISRWVSKRF
ncbi:hypothetical protein PRZ48_005702 [Zasmidium cellare]|uniref:Alpha/beta hydrolase n=1 Tax=Zasmidium cellare TaxID=395010 RepID=A0ABR0EL38_ZASCE|nr:hypothetical protein PRZ48_005702 [Zasmidium cellare]